jgi:hypothetical protein
MSGWKTTEHIEAIAVIGIVISALASGGIFYQFPAISPYLSRKS